MLRKNVAFMPISPRAMARAMVEAAMEMKEVKEPLY